MEAVTVRPAGEADRALLAAVYASTREEEVASFGWTEEQQAAFLANQFEAQDFHYRTHYDGATFEVIEVDGEPAGRLYLHRTPGDIRVMDIALLPPYRGRGIGGGLLRALRDEAEAAGAKLSIHVERGNPARRLYERLGLRVVDEPRPPYLLMEWEPGGG